ncbi:hypothetical protein IMSHALPRED_004878 [Imshaugia aleurites]|uniref:PCI domain-containing protein n=1 Tax=Imshaugia aleurites TaxID=172621 RepID=A0A8H3IGX6_9LECA|nr:hypothetical protein IMSHALPRED_004878 [Imshaugia aleurites]
MDQTQQKALNALEPYILLSKSANSPRAAADLVTQATSAPNTFVFAELLQTPNIQALQTASKDYAHYLTLLQIFAWGTWSDYTETPNLPKLSNVQEQKLRQLTLLSLSTSPSTLTYAHLLSELSLPTTRALEDLVISSIYAGLLAAKLDTLSQRVDVSSVAPLRDLKPGSVPRMVSVLEDWDSRCVSVLGEIEGQIREIRRKAQAQKKREVEHEKAVAKKMGDNEDGKGGKLGKRGGGEEAEEMDIDEGGRRLRGAKRGGGGNFLGGLGRKFGGGN